MKQLTVLLATLVLTCFMLVPAAARADDIDDLDVTMEVFDDVSGLEDEISEMDGPDHDDIRAGERDLEEFEEIEDDVADEMSGDAESEDESGDRRSVDEMDDGFQEDHDFEDERDLSEEDDFESDEGEDIDLDEYDMEDYDDMDDMDETEDDSVSEDGV